MTRLFERNLLLASLPTAEKLLLSRLMEQAQLRTKQQLNQVGTLLRHLYFPLDCAISVMDMQHSGRVVEVAVVGKEGCYCSSALIGLSNSPSHTIVQIGGAVLSVDVYPLSRMMDELPAFTRAVQRFSAVLFRHAIISVGCSHWHSIKQRLSRWLLAHNERVGGTIFPFTHDFLAEQVGTQRTTITEALSSFQRAGLVAYSYGKVELINMEKLRSVSCECFGLAKQAIQDYLRDIQTYAKQ